MSRKFKLRQYCRHFVSMAALCLTGLTGAWAQSPFKGLENLFTIPKGYITLYTNAPPVIDGDINDAAWQQAQWTDDFIDIEGDTKPKPSLQTNVKILWDDSCLYIAARIRDPQVWATITRHDASLFRENDFELFVSPGNSLQQYFEIEYNPLNTVFDLFLSKPYRDGGLPLTSWDARGMRSAIKIRGTLNDPSDTDEGWTIEVAIPFKAITLGSNGRAPASGTLWRINFLRVHWDTKTVDGKYVKLKDSAGRTLPEHDWAWSPQGIVNMHYPDRWGYLQFNKDNTNNTAFVLPYPEEQKRYLWLIYYREKRWHNEHRAYTNSLKDFGLGDSIDIGGIMNSLKIEATDHQFMAFITNEKDHITWEINQEGLVKQLNIRTNE